MAEVKPLYMTSEGFSKEIDVAADSITLAGLTMNGNVVMGSNKVTGLAAGSSSGDALSYAQSGASLAGLSLTANLAMGSNKVTGLAGGSTANEALAYGQSSASLAGLNLTAALTMNSNKVTSLGAATSSGDALSYAQSGASLAGLTLTANLDMSSQKVVNLANGTNPNDAVNLSQLEAAVAGTSWIDPVNTMELIDDSLTTPPGGPAIGDAYIPAATATGAWVGLEGHIVVWDGSSWVDILNAAISDGTRAVITDGTAAGSFSGQEHKIAQYNGASWDFTSPSDGNSVILHNNVNAGPWDALGFNYDTTDAAWTQFTGIATIVAGAGLTKTNQTLDVNVGDGIAISGDAVVVDLATNSGLGFSSGNLAVGAGDGLAASGGTLAVDLAATPGLEFTSGTLRVKAAQGIALDANGANVALTSNAGLEFTGAAPNGTLGIDAGNGVQTTASGLEVDAYDGITVDANGVSVSPGNGIELTGTSPNKLVAAKPNTAAGIAVDASGIAVNNGNGLTFSAGALVPNLGNGLGVAGAEIVVDLDSDPGLEFNAGKLRVENDTLRGIGRDGSGLYLMLSASSGLEFNSGALRIDVANGNELSVSAAGLNVEGLPSLFKINAVAVGATVTAANLDDLTDGSNADSLHTHTAPSSVSAAGKVEKDYTADGGISAGDPVYCKSASKVGSADNTSDTAARVMGVSVDTVATGNPATIVSLGIAEGVLSGATANTPYYLDAGGGLTATRPTSGRRVVLCGYAYSASDLWVIIKDYGASAA